MSIKRKTIIDEATSIGEVLRKMGLVDREQLEQAINEQKNASLDVLIGKLLILSGQVKPEEVEAALYIQEGLRSRKSYRKAIAQADMALYSSSSMVALVKDLKRKVEGIKKTISGEFEALKSISTKDK